MKTTRLLCVVVLACPTILAFGAHTAHAQSTNSPPGFPEVRDLPEHQDMPDPLTMFNGQKVTTPEQWQQRREEMKQILEFYELGHAPPPPGNVTGADLESRDLLKGAVKFRLVHLKFGPEQKLGFDIAIFTPAGDGPFPTIINPSFFGTPGVRSTNAPAVATNAAADAATNSSGTNSSARPRVPLFGGPVTPEAAATSFETCLRRGYAVVTYRYTQCGEDNANFRNSSFYPAYPDYDWGVLLGWAWGLSRCVDYVETQPFADKAKIIALGHSRLGKLTMVATAFDDRISLGAPAGSSGAGTGAYRFCGPGRGGKEGIEDMTRKFPYYFVPRLKEFTGQINKLPFEASWYIALAAPRPWISVEGTEDQNCVANAVKQSVLAAQPVYAFLGVPVDRVGVNYEPHRHALTVADWNAALDFADKYLRGMKVDRTFDHFPPEVSASGSGAGSSAPWDVLAFGATDDGKTKDTAAFQKALDACAAAGGGEVLAPAGDYLLGSIELKSNTILRLEKGTRLMGSPDLDDYPVIKVRWEGRWVDGHRALIFATNAAHIGIIGPGEILGNPALGGRTMPRRPVIIEPIDCRDVRLEGFSTQHRSMWSIHPTYCEDVEATNLTIRSTGGNGDGIDVDSCKHVRIESCDISTGDDCVAIKSGRGLEGYRAARPTEDVLISHCTLADSIFACVGIGSETSGGIRGVRIEHCDFSRARTFAIYIKSRPGRGAFIEDISGTDLGVWTAPGGFLRINLLNSGIQDPEPVPGDEGIPTAKNFSFSDVKVHCGTLVDAASIPAAKPLQGLKLTNLTGDCTKAIALANLTGEQLSGINVTGYVGQFLTQTNVEGSGLMEPPK
jgi:Glycosyl hydrolases family 28